MAAPPLSAFPKTPFFFGEKHHLRRRDACRGTMELNNMLSPSEIVRRIERARLAHFEGPRITNPRNSRWRFLCAWRDQDLDSSPGSSFGRYAICRRVSLRGVAVIQPSDSGRRLLLPRAGQRLISIPAASKKTNKSRRSAAAHRLSARFGGVPEKKPSAMALTDESVPRGQAGQAGLPRENKYLSGVRGTRAI